MVVCIPIVDDQALASRVSAHFRAAPLFLLFDTDAKQGRVLVNDRAARHRGRCEPVPALASERIDAYLVGGIGRRALSELEASGAKVFAVRGGTAAEALTAFVEGRLERVSAAAREDG